MQSARVIETKAGKQIRATTADDVTNRAADLSETDSMTSAQCFVTHAVRSCERLNSLDYGRMLTRG